MDKVQELVGRHGGFFVPSLLLVENREGNRGWQGSARRVPSEAFLRLGGSPK